jgi:hypothetical protein
MQLRFADLLVVAASLTMAAPGGLPAAAMEVILMRHADKDTRRGDYNLSPSGFRRAVALATLIPACFGKPDRITTFYLDPRTSKNARSYQSAVPLAVATGVNIRIAEASRLDSFGEGQRLRQQADGPAERVVLFWEHRRMPELARGLGWDGMPAIAEDDFDQLIVFRLARPGGIPQVWRYRQSELFERPCYREAESPLFSTRAMNSLNSVR